MAEIRHHKRRRVKICFPQNPGFQMGPSETLGVSFIQSLEMYRLQLRRHLRVPPIQYQAELRLLEMAGANAFVDQKIKQRRVMLFSKTFSPECKMVKEILEGYQLSNENYEVVEIESRQDCTQIENYFQILCLNDSRSMPQLFVKGKYIGGEKEIPRLHESGELKKILTS